MKKVCSGEKRPTINKPKHAAINGITSNLNCKQSNKGKRPLLPTVIVIVVIIVAIHFMQSLIHSPNSTHHQNLFSMEIFSYSNQMSFGGFDADDFFPSLFTALQMICNESLEQTLRKKAFVKGRRKKPWNLKFIILFHVIEFTLNRSNLRSRITR